uniref:Uncharacterized protein n=1 Tax=Arundo donax TaxID=35708 RepID=A0A0A9AJU0_ARUDO
MGYMKCKYHGMPGNTVYSYKLSSRKHLNKGSSSCEGSNVKTLIMLSCPYDHLKQIISQK